jgi:hypothetical protein
MRFARRFLIFSYGLFTVAAQTLLFREFVTSFESNDISVGIFFGCWFLWVGLGAVIVRSAEGLSQKLLRHIELFLLAYIPAFILQFILIVQVRQIAGVESYALLTVREVLFLALLVNAPVSIITGMLFPVACRWFEEGNKEQFTFKSAQAESNSETKGVAVWRVYILEAAGSFVGGLGVTVLLGNGQSSVRIFFILSFIISLSVFFVRFFDRQQRAEDRGQKTEDEHQVRWYPLANCTFFFVLSLCFLICISAGID